MNCPNGPSAGNVRRSAAKMLLRPRAHAGRGAGCHQKYPRLPAKGEIFSLTSPFIEQLHDELSECTIGWKPSPLRGENVVETQSSRRERGWMPPEIPPASSQRGNIFLDIPFYRTAPR